MHVRIFYQDSCIHCLASQVEILDWKTLHDSNASSFALSNAIVLHSMCFAAVGCKFECLTSLDTMQQRSTTTQNVEKHWYDEDVIGRTYGTRIERIYIYYCQTTCPVAGGVRKKRQP